MTYNQFERRVLLLSKKSYNGVETDPVRYGIGRANFECKKLEQLIALAGRVKSKVARRKAAAWRRKLERVRLKRLHLEQRQTEMNTFPQPSLLERLLTR